MRTILVITSILIAAAFSAQAQEQKIADTVRSAPEISIETQVDRAEIYIGDLINYRLTIIHDSDILLTPPPIGANLGAFDVKDYSVEDEVRLDDGRLKSESRFLLTTFTTGDYIIPPIPVEYTLPDSTVRILISEPVPIKVKSLLAEAADTADIRDLKAPIGFRSGIPKWYFILGGAIVLIGGGILIWWWRRRRLMAPAEPVDLRKPWEIAFEALAVLKEKDYPVSGELKQFYVELTEIVRAYLQRIFGLPVLDMTTYEFLTAILQKDIGGELYNILKGFLEFADLVKFAKLIPDLKKVEADFEQAVDIVERIREIEMSKITAPAVRAPVAITGGGDV